MSFNDNRYLYPIHKYFSYDHLPEHLQKVSKPFCELAELMVNDLHNPSGGPELSTALRKLLESKDCAVRAILQKDTD